ncbi:MlaD family protein, partial [Acidiphilium sp.]
MADPDAPEARFRGTRWPGLIWAVPVAAALIVAWLGVAALATRGPEVVVTFPITGGIRPGGTDVTYRGATVGHVVSVHLDASLAAMKVRLRFDPDMDGHLGRGTRYWIAGRHVSFGNLASLKSVIAGPHIAV